MKLKTTLTTCLLLLWVVALAGLFPKFLKEVPQELQGNYALLVKTNPDKTKEILTNAPPFVTFFSNRIAFAAGGTRSVERVMRITQKGTNVYVVSFENKSSWMITEAGSPDRLVVLESSKTNSKSATTLVIRREPSKRDQTNTPPIPLPIPQAAEPLKR